MYELVSLNVDGSNDNEIALPGRIMRVSGYEKAPKCGSWVARDSATDGPLVLTTTRVTGMDVGPVRSSATRLKLQLPLSCNLGVPESVRLELSSWIQAGAPCKE